MTPQLRHAYYGSRPEKFMHIRACTKLSANFYQPGVYGSAITVWATAVPMFFDTGITGGIGQSANWHNVSQLVPRNAAREPPAASIHSASLITSTLMIEIRVQPGPPSISTTTGSMASVRAASTNSP
jgi:hypothetical protein